MSVAPVKGLASRRGPSQALILAAGFGSRLRLIAPSKPLMPVRGVALLQLGILQAAAAGVERVVVVTGHEAERVEAALPGFGQAAGVCVEAARLQDWSLPNGFSVMAGAARIDGDYLLMMADHILSRPILLGLAGCGGTEHGVTLAIDRRVTSPLIDPDDATWVRTRAGGAISRIGKTIDRYDAVDCGAFLATPELSEAIALAVSAGASGSLSDGMQVLADEGRAATLDIGDAWWIDVDDPRAHALAEALVETELPEVYAPQIFARAARSDWSTVQAA